jgi:Holliday junction resolvasome RuvABC endonuclease subunit
MNLLGQPGTINLLALDISSSKTGYAVYDRLSNTWVDVGLFDYKKEDFLYAQFARDIKALIEQHNISDIVAEDCFAGVNPQTFRVLARLQGVLIAMCEAECISYKLKMPSTWRKQAGVLYNCKLNFKKTDECKEAALELATTVLGGSYKIASDDVSDAVCIALSDISI